MELTKQNKAIIKMRLKTAKTNKAFHERLRDMSIRFDKEMQQVLVEEEQVLIDHYTKLLNDKV